MEKDHAKQYNEDEPWNIEKNAGIASKTKSPESEKKAITEHGKALCERRHDE
jgi:hypothetical protein